MSKRELKMKKISIRYGSRKHFSSSVIILRILISPGIIKRKCKKKEKGRFKI